MSRWSDDPGDFARADDSSRFGDEHLPGDAPEDDADQHGPDFAAPSTNARPDLAQEERRREAERAREHAGDRSGLFADVRFSAPMLIIVGALVLALVIAGGLYLRSQRLQREVGTDGQPSAGETTLVPRTGEPPVPQTARVGQRVHVQGLYGTGWVTVVTTEWSDRGSIPPKNDVYFNIDLLVEAEEGTLLVRSTQYATYDTSAEMYVPTIGADKQPFLTDQEVTGPGTSARGWVSFDVPRQPLRLEITDEGYNQLVTIDVFPPG